MERAGARKAFDGTKVVTRRARPGFMPGSPQWQISTQNGCFLAPVGSLAVPRAFVAPMERGTLSAPPCGTPRNTLPFARVCPKPRIRYLQVDFRISAPEHARPPFHLGSAAYAARGFPPDGRFSGQADMRFKNKRAQGGPGTPVTPISAELGNL